MRSSPPWFWVCVLIIGSCFAFWAGITPDNAPNRSRNPPPSSPPQLSPSPPTSPTPPLPTPPPPTSPAPPEGNPVSADRTISAEVMFQPNQANPAALALQQRGFRILHIGPTISVEAPRSLWESTFNVQFTEQSRPQMRQIPGSRVTYLQPTSDNVQVPDDLRSLVADIMFVQPPELF